MKKTALIVAAGALSLVLAACGQKLSTTKSTYQRSGMVAVIKGSASGHSNVSYTADAASGSSKVNDGSYVISLPVSTKDQQVAIKAGDQKTTVTVKAAKSLGTYATIAKKYNQAIIMTALPAKTQKALAAASKQSTTDTSQLTTAQKMALAKEQQALQAAVQKATTATKASQLPTSVTGLKQVLKSTGGTIRVNVQDGQLMGITDIVPVKALKEKKLQQAFGTQFGLLANSVGADAKKVAKQFQKATKSSDSSSTTIDTITSNGVKFDVGYSTTSLYIYITK